MFGAGWVDTSDWPRWLWAVLIFLGYLIFDVAKNVVADVIADHTQGWLKRKLEARALRKEARNKQFAIFIERMATNSHDFAIHAVQRACYAAVCFGLAGVWFVIGFFDQIEGADLGDYVAIYLGMAFVGIGSGFAIKLALLCYDVAGKRRDLREEAPPADLGPGYASQDELDALTETDGMKPRPAPQIDVEGFNEALGTSRRMAQDIANELGGPMWDSPDDGVDPMK